ncbi:unnamed protein product, partial [Ectocarpus sp. 12 AP-2014]
MSSLKRPSALVGPFPHTGQCIGQRGECVPHVGDLRQAEDVALLQGEPELQ